MIGLLPPGTELFGMVTPSVMKSEIKHALNADPRVNNFGFKGFRAGRATETAKAGQALGEILLAGEWVSRAFVQYVDINQIEKGKFLEVALEQSGDEAEN